MKNKKKSGVLLLLIGVIIVIFVISDLYSNVNGAKMSELIKSDQIDKIQIVKTYETSEKSDVIEQVVLNNEQRTMLLSLLENTKFKKLSSGAIPYRDKIRYLITAETSDNMVLFRIESYGGEFVLVDAMTDMSPPKHWRMRIKNSQWKSIIEKIIELAN